MATARSWLRLHTTCVALLFGFVSASPRIAFAASAPLELTELLATGDAVGRLGHVGSTALRLHGMADNGKALVGVQLSDGRFGLVLADGNAVVPLWLSHTSSETPEPWFASIEPSGRVIATTALTASTQTVYEVTTGGLRRIAGSGDVDSSGRTLCGFYAPRINSNGAAAFYAYSRQSADCAALGEDFDRAIYTTAERVLRRVSDNVAQQLTGIADDGTLVLSTWGGQDDGEITRWHDGQTRRVVGGGDIGPSGGPLRWVFGRAVSRTGEVLFQATEDERAGLYRTDQGRIIRVLSVDDRPPIGLAFESLLNHGIAPAALNEHGDVVVTPLVRFDDAGHGGAAVLLYPAAGSPQVLMASGPEPRFGPRYVNLLESNVSINASREAAFSMLAFGGSSSGLVVRWHDGVIDRLVGTGDPGPGGGLIAAGGLAGSMCLAADGSVAVSAEATNGRHGLACVDASGTHLIAQSGEPDSAGRELDNFGYYENTHFAQCAFAAGQLFFNGSYLEPSAGGDLYAEPALYRARADGIDRLIGGGDRIGELTVYRPSRQFAVNAAGHLVTSIRSDELDGETVVLFRDDRFETIMPPYVLPAGDPHTIGGAFRPAITDGDVVALLGVAQWPGADDSARRKGEGNVVVFWENGATRVLVDSDDVAADGAPYGNFSQILARGNRIAFAARRGRGIARRIFLYELDGGVPRLVYPVGPPEPGVGLPQLVDMAANGTILVNEGYLRWFRVTPDGAPEELLTGDTGTMPFALNDAGNVAVIAYESSLGRLRSRILLAGNGGAAASCLDPPAPVTPTPTVEPVPNPAATAASCTGDCNGDGHVGIDELLRSVRCMIGIIIEPPECNDCGIRRIDEMIAAVNNALNGCH